MPSSPFSHDSSANCRSGTREVFLLFRALRGGSFERWQDARLRGRSRSFLADRWLRRTVVNWLKAMLLMVVLGAILYGVNFVLNKSAPPETPANDANWSTDGPSAAPAGATNGSTGGITPAFAQQANNAQPSGESPVASTVTPPANPPAESNSYSPNTPPPPTSDSTMNGSNRTSSPQGLSAGGPSIYPTATPAIVSSESTHASIPATPVGMTTESNAMQSTRKAFDSPSSSLDFDGVMNGVMTTLREGRLAEGLQRLTLMYDDPRLTADQNQRLRDLLGKLAGTVVYSQKHLLLPPYEIKPGDRLDTIAEEYQVPAALLVKINRIADPDHPPAGQKIKAIRGPFMALVNLNQRELTLVVQQCYAGRFNLAGVGKDAAAMKGVYKVDRKSLDTPNHPSDLAHQGLPALHHWIGFSNDQHESFGFCGASNPTAGEEPRGVMLSSADAMELFDILSVGSSIVVR
jgi:LysM repeat protein